MLHTASFLKNVTQVVFLIVQRIKSISVQTQLNSIYYMSKHVVLYNTQNLVMSGQMLI
jgi:hypothetical protein